MNLFLNACGVRRPLQIEVENRISHRVEIRSLDQPFAIIGRDHHCDIVLEDKQVSRRHVYLQLIGGRLFWIDLDSQIGTFAEGQAWKSGWLGDGRVIAVGPNDIRQIDPAASASADVSDVVPQGSPLIWRNYGTEPLVDVTVEFLNGPSESKIWPIRRALSLIGTARRCKFRLADRSIEPFHCALIRTHQGLFVVDLLGGEGIKVNETPARSARVTDGDTLQIGRYQIRIHYQSPEAKSGTRPIQAGSAVVANSFEPGLPVPLPSTSLAELSRNPQVEIMPFGIGANDPVSIDRNDLTQSVLVPLVSQFGIMQQQMFDQFQQTMNMMVQMFGKMHDSQMELIRQEFERLNDLTKEINGLKSELAEMSRKQSEAAVPPSPPMPIPRPSMPITRDIPLRSRGRPSEETGSDSPGKAGTTPRPQPPEPAPGGATQGDRDAIVWLHQRITSIQNEREGRWQKLMKLLPGNS